MKVCTYCHKTFLKTEHLLRHERSHTGEKPYQCRACGRRYARSDVLLRHAKVFHGQENGGRNTQGDAADDGSGPLREGNNLANDSPNNNGEDDNDIVDKVGPSPTQESTAVHIIQIMNSPAIIDGQRLDTTELDALATASLAHARQEGLTRSPNTSMQATHGFVDPGFSATPSGPDNSIAEYASRDTLFTGGNDAALPSSMIGGPYAAETQNIDSIFDMYSGTFNSIDFTNFCADGSFLPTGLSSFGSSSERASSIPLERFALVSRLWPNNKSHVADNHLTNLWTEVINYKGDNILTDIAISETSPAPLINKKTESQWGLDEDKRRDLILEFAADASTNNDNDAASFPPLRLLNLGLDVVFRQSHSLLPFVHQPTFSAKSAPNSIVLPLCLLGLLLLDSKQARALALSYLPDVTRKCCQQLGVTSFGQGGWITLITRLMSGTLLIMAWTICPARDHQYEMLTRMLYIQVISVANVAGLFAERPASASMEELQERLKSSDGSRNQSQPQNDDGLWKAWARIESLKRLITALIGTDSWWSYSLGESPLLRADKIHFEHPCSPELFQASSARVWRRLMVDGTGAASRFSLIQAYELALVPSESQNVSPVGVVGLLSIIWIRILEYRPHGKVPPVSVQPLPDEPCRVFAQEEPGRAIFRMLNDVYIAYASYLRFKNPNCITMWHFLNLNLFANLETIDLAAGRNGADDAHEALQSVAAWSQTWYARRACLHAAGIHASMNRRRIKDGTMLHSELSIFSAALVLGLYVFMKAPNKEDDSNQAKPGADMELYELLNEVDWPDLSGAGSALTLSPSSNTEESQESPARRFVREGGVVSFSGVICDGGYNAAKMILLEFASLLEEVGKWNATGLCRILRIMSDSLLDMDDQMDTT